MFAVAACCNEPKTARLTPRIPIYNSQGLPGHEHTKDTQNILGHPVIVKDGWLQPWMNYDTMFVWSMNFIIDGPVYESPDGLLPGYLVTSSYGSDGSRNPDFFPEDRIYRNGANINNQGGNAYYAMKLFRYYYPYTGEIRALVPVKELLDRMAKFTTPEDWAWPGMVRVQDNDVLVLFSELREYLSVALSGCDLLYLRHNSSPILSRSCMATLYSSALVDFPCQPTWFSIKETPLPFTVLATMHTGLSFTSRAS